MPPRISTIIPTYNRAADVQRAIESVLAQDYPQDRIEVIVVDDGGSDDTGPVLARRFGARVRVERKPNGGVSSARNHGVRLATGDLLAFLDSDDLWRPSKLRRQEALLAADPACALALTDIEMVDDRGATSGFLRRRESQYAGDQIALAALVRFPDFTPSSALVRRDVFDALGGYDESLPTAEDIDFFLRLALRHGVANVEEPLTIALRHPTTGLSNLKRTTHDFVAVVERWVASHALSPELAHSALFSTYVRNARTSMWSGDVAHSLECLARCVPHVRTRVDADELARFSVTISRALAGQVKRRINREMRRILSP